MRTKTSIALFLLIPAALAAGDLPAGKATPFAAMMTSYESIRIALFNDRMAGVAQSARDLASEAAALTWRFSAQAAGVSPADIEAVKDLLPEIRERAGQLASATDLEQARAALGELTKPLVRYRKLLTADDLPIVVYCPMSQLAWLQPEGEIQNPYYGRSMGGCGEVIPN